MAACLCEMGWCEEGGAAGAVDRRSPRWQNSTAQMDQGEENHRCSSESFIQEYDEDADWATYLHSTGTFGTKPRHYKQPKEIGIDSVKNKQKCRWTPKSSVFSLLLAQESCRCNTKNILLLQKQKERSLAKC